MIVLTYERLDTDRTTCLNLLIKKLSILFRTSEENVYNVKWVYGKFFNKSLLRII